MSRSARRSISRRSIARRCIWTVLPVILPKWIWRLWTGGGNRAQRARLLLWGVRDGLRRDTRLSLTDLRSELARHDG